MSAYDSQLVCRGCGTELPPDDPSPFRCPAARAGDDIDHLVDRRLSLEGIDLPAALSPDESPFVVFRELLHSWRLARRRGLADEAFIELVKRLDRAVAATDAGGIGFRPTPLVDCRPLTDELGVEALWIKDETHNVAGSHKARHLMGLELFLAVCEETGLVDPIARRARLAIASCGNAALAAATIAKAAGRELDVFIPSWAGESVLKRLGELGAHCVVCERAPDEAGAPDGDPCIHAFRAAVDAGALPFCCQGNENGLAIEGGTTLGWELALQLRERGTPLHRIAVQVGGGALLSSTIQALRQARELNVITRLPRIHAVQTSGAHPLHRAWRKLGLEIAVALGTAADDLSDAALAERIAPNFELPAVQDALRAASHKRSAYMWPWEQEPMSIASGILDDETYDWHAIVSGMLESGGWPVVVSEDLLKHVHAGAREATGIEVGATGTAGLAGLYELQHRGALSSRESCAVLFTGIGRSEG